MPSNSMTTEGGMCCDQSKKRHGRKTGRSKDLQTRGRKHTHVPAELL